MRNLTIIAIFNGGGCPRESFMGLGYLMPDFNESNITVESGFLGGCRLNEHLDGCVFNLMGANNSEGLSCSRVIFPVRMMPVGRYNL